MVLCLHALPKSYVISEKLFTATIVRDKNLNMAHKKSYFVSDSLVYTVTINIMICKCVPDIVLRESNKISCHFFISLSNGKAYIVT